MKLTFQSDKGGPQLVYDVPALLIRGGRIYIPGEEKFDILAKADDDARLQVGPLTFDSVVIGESEDLAPEPAPKKRRKKRAKKAVGIAPPTEPAAPSPTAQEVADGVPAAGE